MTKPVSPHQFHILCAKHTIAPSVAIENDELFDALLNGDIERVEQILANDF